MKCARARKQLGSAAEGMMMVVMVVVVVCGGRFMFTHGVALGAPCSRNVEGSRTKERFGVGGGVHGQVGMSWFMRNSYASTVCVCGWICHGLRDPWHPHPPTHTRARNWRKHCWQALPCMLGPDVQTANTPPAAAGYDYAETWSVQGGEKQLGTRKRCKS